MFLLFVLTIMLICLVIFVAAAIAVGGAGFVIVFGDVIVCIGVIGFLIYLIVRKKRES